MMSSNAIPEILSKSIVIENAYATISYRKKALDDNMPKRATLTKAVRFNFFPSYVKVVRALAAKAPEHAVAKLEGKPTAKLKRLTSIRRQEWLESGTEHGFIRLYAPAGLRSLIYPATLQTTVQDICSILGFE
ncbi:unnamed protein product, partial [Litomosoides sigmodontis]